MSRKNINNDTETTIDDESINEEYEPIDTEIDIDIDDIEDESIDLDDNIDDDDEDIINEDELLKLIEDEKQDEYIIVEGDDRITDPILTKYEYVRAICERAGQLAKGAKPLVKGDIKIFSPVELANLELKHKTSPLIILRPLPNNVVEKWYINELENPYEI